MLTLIAAVGIVFLALAGWVGIQRLTLDPEATDGHSEADCFDCGQRKGCQAPQAQRANAQDPS